MTSKQAIEKILSVLPAEDVYDYDPGDVVQRVYNLCINADDTPSADVQERAKEWANRKFPGASSGLHSNIVYTYLAGASSVSGNDLTGIEREVKASMLIMPPDDVFKKGWNSAMQKVLSIIKNYKDGKGLFQNNS